MIPSRSLLAALLAPVLLALPVLAAEPAALSLSKVVVALNPTKTRTPCRRSAVTSLLTRTRTSPGSALRWVVNFLCSLPIRRPSTQLVRMTDHRLIGPPNC